MTTQHSGGINISHEECPICSGMGIISTVTGLPPNNGPQDTIIDNIENP
jgi:hypothetical protein